jgi:hypothetical protein
VSDCCAHGNEHLCAMKCGELTEGLEAYYTYIFAFRLILCLLLGAFAKLRKTAISFVMFRPSVWNNSAHIERIFFKFDI